MAQPSPLPPGWSQHTAPSGHTYYYNAQTKESTYRRPALPPPPPPPPLPTQTKTTLPIQPPPHQPPIGQGQPSSGVAPPYLRLSDPAVANAFLAQQQRASAGTNARPQSHQQQRPRRQPHDKPRSKTAIPGCEPWFLVTTKYGRRFVYHGGKQASYWRIPDKLKAGILELDRERILRKNERSEDKDERSEEKRKDERSEGKNEDKNERSEDKKDYDSDEYEEVEVEVTDDEDGGEEHAHKRQRTEEADEDEDEDHGQVEFSEADIAFQLQAMGGYDEYEAEDDYNYAEGDEEGEPAEHDERAEPEDNETAFRSLLDDLGISPFNAWDTVLEEGKLFDDPRYRMLPTVKMRRAVFEQWCRDKVQERKAAERKKQKDEKKDPRLGYLDLLQRHATPKLYWAEFKRKYRREDAMRDHAVTDRDREKWYREYVARRKLTAAQRKTDLVKLLGEVEAELKSGDGDLPSKVLVDMRYVAVDPEVRDPIVAAYRG